MEALGLTIICVIYFISDQQVSTELWELCVCVCVCVCVL